MRYTDERSKKKKNTVLNICLFPHNTGYFSFFSKKKKKKKKKKKNRDEVFYFSELNWGEIIFWR